ncbi:MAG TPA: LuxR C-terminal-related transcriptional regulator [Streptosporangiaceae bacterium]
MPGGEGERVGLVAEALGHDGVEACAQRTDLQIAGDLLISVRTVRSHLDRIRDKTGLRWRADLTRLALQEGLV